MADMNPPETPAVALASSETDRGIPSWQRSLWKLMDFRIGIVPVPIYALLALAIAYLNHIGKLPTDISVMIGIISLGAFACAELGERIPLLKKIGGAAILCTIIPSFVVFYHLLPTALVKPVIDFTSYTFFLYLYIACVIVGSIMGMDRAVMIKCFLKICIPATIGTILAAAVGIGVGWAFGLDVKHVFFYVIVPIMAGGVGEGAIPLSIGYADVLHAKQGEIYALVLPPVILGSFVAMILSGLLNAIGKKYPRLTGDGRLEPDEHDEIDARKEGAIKAHLDLNGVASAALFAVGLYVAGVAGKELCGLPAPIGMLFLAVVVKLSRAVPPQFQESSYLVYRFCAIALTYPVLFTNSLAITPWDKLVAACAPANLITIVATVTTMVVTGFLTARWINMYPVELAIVNACRCSKGGSGVVAILDTAKRMQLMPFAQVAVRLGGAITVTLAILALAKFR